MGLRAILENIEDAQENEREFYVEQNGRYVLAVEDDVRDHPKVKALKVAFERSQNDGREIKERLSAAEKRLEGLPDDFDAAKYEELRIAVEAGGGRGKEAQERMSAMMAEKDRKTADAIRKKNEELAEIRRDLEITKIDEGLNKALVDARIGGEYLEAVRHLLKGQAAMKLVKDQGRYLALVETDMGSVPLERFVEDWSLSDKAKPFIPRATGGDAKGGTGRTFDKNPWAKETRNLTEQQRMLVENPERARAMAAAAGQKLPQAAA